MRPRLVARSSKILSGPLEYVALERKLAAQNPIDRDTYIEGEISLIVAILEQSAMTLCELSEAVDTSQTLDRCCDELADEPIAML